MLGKHFIEKKEFSIFVEIEYSKPYYVYENFDSWDGWVFRVVNCKLPFRQKIFDIWC
jgi:hypothetical protein